MVRNQNLRQDTPLQAWPLVQAVKPLGWLLLRQFQPCQPFWRFDLAFMSTFSLQHFAWLTCCHWVAWVGHVSDRWSQSLGLSTSVNQHVKAVSHTQLMIAWVYVMSYLILTLTPTHFLWSMVTLMWTTSNWHMLCWCTRSASNKAIYKLSTRLANVQFGDETFTEGFIIFDVTCAFLSLGNVLRAG